MKRDEVMAEEGQDAERGRPDRPAAAGRPLRRAGLLSLLVLASFCFVFVVGEVGLRIVGSMRGVDYRIYRKQLVNNHGMVPELFVQDPASIVNPLMRPNFTTLSTTADFSVVYDINAEGFRDAEVPVERVAGKKRIVALGDSFTFGIGIADGARFLDLAEREASALEIINLGTPGYGLDQVFLLMIEKGLAYDPDGVVLFINMMDTLRYQEGFYAEGALQLSERVRARLEGNGSQARASAPAAASPASSSSTIYLSNEERVALSRRNWLVRNSQLASWISYQWRLYRLRDRMAKRDQKFWYFVDREIATDVQATPEAWLQQRTSTVVQALYEICRERGIDFAVVNIDHQYPLGFLGDLDPNLAYLDLQPILHEAHEERPLTFTYDHHYNERANRIIADAIGPLLRDVGR